MGFSALMLWVKVIYAIVVLSYFSVLDIKYRDIPDKLVWLSLVGAAVLTGIDYSGVTESLVHGDFLVSAISLVVSVIVILLMVLMYFMDYMGGADVIVVSELFILFPFFKLYMLSPFSNLCIIHLPVLLTLLLYSTLSLLLLFLVRGVYGIIKYYKMLPDDLSTAKKLAIIFIGKPVHVRVYLRLKHYYPLEVFEAGENGVRRSFRLGFNVSEEYYEHQEAIKRLLERGLISDDEYIWVTIGIPFIVPVLLGFLLLLVLGDYPILYFFGGC